MIKERIILTEILEVKYIHDTRSHNSGNIYNKNVHIFSDRTRKVISRELKYIFTKNVAPQLLRHIGLQNMKVGVKTNFELLTPSLSWIAGKY